MKQLTIFDCFPEILTGPAVGEWVTEPGAAICHKMRPSYIGKKVLIDCSTESHKWFRVGILEDYIPYEGSWRSIIFTGKKQRSLVTHRNGIQIYEILGGEYGSD